MEIGIVTVYNSMNYGSFLQAYALKHFLEDRGHDVFFLKWNMGKKLAWNSVMKPIILRKSVSVRGIQAGFGRIRSFEKQNEYFREISTVTGVDLIIVGSDTLWDVARKKFRNPVLYGFVEKEMPVISYAVSCSESTEADFIRFSDLTGNIKNFKHVTVRDLHTKAVMKKSLGIESKVVCDPTLLVEENLWKIQALDIDLSDVILVYAYELPVHIVRHLKRYCSENHLRLISLCIYHPWCDAHMNCRPLEFLSYLKEARHVVTNTFHGTIFSLLAESNLISIENGQKLKNLLEGIGSGEMSLKGNCTYDEFLDAVSEIADYRSVKERIDKMRRESEKIFENILNEIIIQKNSLEG